MKKILITGSKGFVGQELINSLNKINYDLILTGSSQDTDLCDWNIVKKLPKSNVIIHLAAKNYIPDSFDNPHKFFKNNILSTLNILEKARIDDSKVIFLSTYVYGTPDFLPVNEEHKINPLNPYTQSKVLCEDLCASYFRDFKIPITILRPFNIYGKNQKDHFVIPKIISQINKKEIQLLSSETKRDFIYISDVVDVIIKVIQLNKDGLNIYNIGSGNSISIKKLSEKILKISNSKAKLVVLNKLRKGEIPNTISDNSKIKKELNWEPKISIDTGINLIINQ